VRMFWNTIESEVAEATLRQAEVCLAVDHINCQIVLYKSHINPIYISWFVG